MRFDDFRALTESEARIPYLVNSFGDELIRRAHGQMTPEEQSVIDNQIGATDAERLVHFMATFDPSPGKRYLPWIVSRYAKGKFKLEDLDKLPRMLQLFWRLVQSKRIENRDINAYAGMADLFGALQPFLKSEKPSNAAEKKRQQMLDPSVTKVLADTAAYSIVIPLTFESSRYWGSGTNWCTVGGKGHFDRYSAQGPLHIVTNKETGRRYQLCFEAGEFMDETDDLITGEEWAEIPLGEFTQRQRTFVAMYGDECPYLKDIQSLDALTEEDKEKAAESYEGSIFGMGNLPNFALLGLFPYLSDEEQISFLGQNGIEGEVREKALSFFKPEKEIDSTTWERLIHHARNSYQIVSKAASFLSTDTLAANSQIYARQTVASEAICQELMRRDLSGLQDRLKLALLRMSHPELVRYVYDQTGGPKYREEWEHLLSGRDRLVDFIKLLAYRKVDDAILATHVIKNEQISKPEVIEIIEERFDAPPPLRDDIGDVYIYGTGYISRFLVDIREDGIPIWMSTNWLMPHAPDQCEHLLGVRIRKGQHICFGIVDTANEVTLAYTPQKSAWIGNEWERNAALWISRMWGRNDGDDLP